MLQIRPQEPFPIVYLLSDPGDTGTYYVRTVLRNSATGVVLKIGNNDYANLAVDGNNSRRFSILIEAPNDPSGAGFWIDATTTVYTDAAYTTVASNYAEQLDRHLVAERWSMALGGGGVRGQTPEPVDYEKFGGLLKDHLAKLDFPKPEHTDLSYITDLLESIHHFVQSFEFPDQEKIDFGPHAEKIISELGVGIKAIPPADLSPVIDKIAQLPTPHTPTDVLDLLKPHLARIEKEIVGHLKDIKKVNDDFPVVSVRARVAKEEKGPMPSRLERILSKI